MSLAEIEEQVLALSDEERRQFAAWFLENRERILPPGVEETSEEIKTELQRRRQEYIDHPERFRRVETREELTRYFDEIRDEVRSRISSAR
ncbi:MAG TPA: hypothetical protein VK961_02700 [Chthoniobacter sp.]|nr:hypothetical protein [Chthoniobacter sp.]